MTYEREQENESQLTRASSSTSTVTPRPARTRSSDDDDGRVIPLDAAAVLVAAADPRSTTEAEERRIASDLLAEEHDDLATFIRSKAGRRDVAARLDQIRAEPEPARRDGAAMVAPARAELEAARRRSRERQAANDDQP